MHMRMRLLIYSYSYKPRSAQRAAAAGAGAAQAVHRRSGRCNNGDEYSESKTCKMGPGDYVVPT